MTMTKAKENKIIDDCFYAIPYIGHSFSDVSTVLFNLCLEGEKKHRKGHPPIKGFSTIQAAKYFSVKWLFDGNTSNLSANDIINVRLAVLYGQAFAQTNKEKLQPFFDFVANSEFDSVGYAELMSS